MSISVWDFCLPLTHLRTGKTRFHFSHACTTCLVDFLIGFALSGARSTSLFLLKLSDCVEKVDRSNWYTISFSTDSGSKAWKGNCGVYMRCRGINSDWCTCWNACIRRTVAFSTHCSFFTSTWMVSKVFI